MTSSEPETFPCLFCNGTGKLTKKQFKEFLLGFEQSDPSSSLAKNAEMARLKEE